MAEPSKLPEEPNVTDTAGFLRRFADLMSNGYNADYLRRAADLLELLTTRIVALSDEENLARYRYETLNEHADALEAECEGLKHDIEGHLNTASSILSERDALHSALQSRETELSGLRDALNRRDAEHAAVSEAYEAKMAGLRAEFDSERKTLEAAARARNEELDQVRGGFEGERKQHAKRLGAHEGELSELRLSFDRERSEFFAQLKDGASELAALRIASQGESEQLKARIAELEAKRAELRSAFGRISDLRGHTDGFRDGYSVSAIAMLSPEADANASSAQSMSANPAVGETDTIVPKDTLRQARAQFEYLAKEFIPLGDIASQVMCELGAYTMDMALTAGEPTASMPADEVALSLLASSASLPLDLRRP